VDIFAKQNWMMMRAVVAQTYQDYEVYSNAIILTNLTR
jgi:hypothetical protein